MASVPQASSGAWCQGRLAMRTGWTAIGCRWPVTFPRFVDIASMSTRSTTFHQLYSKHAEAVYRFALFLTGNSADARDITSETFVRVWTATEDPRIESVKAYLFAIARNLYRRQWRRAARFDALDQEVADVAATPHETVEQQEEFRRTLRAMQELSELDRTVILMRAEDELTYQDISAATGLSVPAAKVRVFRARERLLALLQTDTGKDHEHH